MVARVGVSEVGYKGRMSSMEGTAATDIGNKTG